MNRIKENQQFLVVLSSGHQNEHFQEIAFYGLVWLLRKLYIFIKLAFSIDFLLDFKGAFPLTMTILKIMDFKENDLFQENEQNEHISVKLQISVLLSKFQKRALYRLQFLHRKLSIFTKWTDFSEISCSQWHDIM